MTTNQEFKSREYDNWSRAAAAWKTYDAHNQRLFAPVTERMLVGAAVGAGQRVLDIACGTGEPAIPAALQVGPTGSVLATDFSDDMLAVARAKARERGLTNIELRRVDGEELDLAEAFDTVLIRFGIMFMPDALACLTQSYRALRTGGRISVATWAAVDRNPWLGIALGAIKRHVEVPAPPPGAPGLFTYADPAKLRSTLEAAGFAELRVDEVPFKVTGFSPADYFRYITQLSAPLSALLAKATPEVRSAIEADAVAELGERTEGGSVTLDAVAWVASGRRTR
jgi:ubiquinone/menaquinone biosynthesis C-methylase UbiE